MVATTKVTPAGRGPEAKLPHTMACTRPGLCPVPWLAGQAHAKYLENSEQRCCDRLTHLTVVGRLSSLLKVTQLVKRLTQTGWNPGLIKPPHSSGMGSRLPTRGANTHGLSGRGGMGVAEAWEETFDARWAQLHTLPPQVALGLRSHQAPRHPEQPETKLAAPGSGISPRASGLPGTE